MGWGQECDIPSQVGDPRAKGNPSLRAETSEVSAKHSSGACSERGGPCWRLHPPLRRGLLTPTPLSYGVWSAPVQLFRTLSPGLLNWPLPDSSSHLVTYKAVTQSRMLGKSGVTLGETLRWHGDCCGWLGMLEIFKFVFFGDQFYGLKLLVNGM